MFCSENPLLDSSASEIVYRKEYRLVSKLLNSDCHDSIQVIDSFCHLKIALVYEGCKTFLLFNLFYAVLLCDDMT